MLRKKSRVAIIGAGFTGLAAGLKLAREGYLVTIFEAGTSPGGLAGSFKDQSWKWRLEKHYHHLFKTDNDIQELARSINHPIIFLRPKTSTYLENQIKQIDGPLALLKFPYLNLFSRLRTGIVLLSLKLNSQWQPLEKITVESFIKKTMGKNSWQILWKPLMVKKFGRFYKIIPASWFWARIKSRSSSLGYPDKGFQSLADNLARAIIKRKGKIYYSAQIVNIRRDEEGIILKNIKGKTFKFDKVICSLPTPLFIKITSGLDEKYTSSLKKLEGIGAQNLTLELKESFLKDGTYWLNINEEKFPFLAIVEHTNFIDKSNYNSHSLIYIGNYLDKDRKHFQKDKEYLIKKYLPYLKKINPKFNESWIINSWLFKADFAQPIVYKNYSKSIPQFKTPIENLYLANVQQVYPWDRGTNYAVALGNKVVEYIKKDSKND